MSTNIQARPRLDFIDAERGVAVLFMLWLHTADGWLRPALKQGSGWGLIRSVGGHAAPIFLLLAGLSLGLTWAGPKRPDARSELARGLQLVVLGYALRAQMWMLDAGGYRQWKGWLAAVPLALGYAALYGGLSAYARRSSARARLAFGTASAALGLALVAALIPSRFLPLLRVDVLQAIGASLVCLAALRPLFVRQPVVGLGLGAAVAFFTPAMRAAMPGILPMPLAGYVAAWDVQAGQLTPTLFPLFPWLAYAAIGATLGLWLGRAPSAAHALRNALALSALGVVLALSSCEAFRPAQRLIAAAPDLTQLVRVSYRVGVALALFAFAIAVCRPWVPFRNLFLSLGRASLFVYWVHLEFAFGAFARPLAHRLDFPHWAVGLSLAVVAMTVASAGWLRLRARFAGFGTGRAVRSESPQPSPAPGSGMWPRSP